MDEMKEKRSKRGLASLTPEQRKAAQEKSRQTRALKKAGVVKPKKPLEQLTPMQAIKQKCLDCSNMERKEVSMCPVKTCPLWPKRSGRKSKKYEKQAEVIILENNDDHDEEFDI